MWISLLPLHSGGPNQLHTADTQHTPACLHKENPHLIPCFHICQPFKVAPGSCGSHDLPAILKSHVGDQLLPLPPPLTVNDGYELTEFEVELILALIEIRLLFITAINLRKQLPINNPTMVILYQNSV